MTGCHLALDQTCHPSSARNFPDCCKAVAQDESGHCTGAPATVFLAGAFRSAPASALEAHARGVKDGLGGLHCVGMDAEHPDHVGDAHHASASRDALVGRWLGALEAPENLALHAREAAPSSHTGNPRGSASPWAEARLLVELGTPSADPHLLPHLQLDLLDPHAPARPSLAYSMLVEALLCPVRTFSEGSEGRPANFSHPALSCAWCKCAPYSKQP
mmetsp:Transcript_96085/g.228833  ORF Transcript_96085/g.228833 Transcript_96085/m.228833 type:complete len:217 (+) Transcript_96085:163-813(+)